ncbi:hypothetical protein [Burkholderia diffusa]|uniref:hypothetical protein n=1 Tax=Burkholderia diffusa TaxID=488732 RepID=UPI00075E9FFB|nr:hypothetical protein [Burkholderia diffusa]KVN06957.1 hypothetical protein WJ62_05760 [Burkholderia diffusa]
MSVQPVRSQASRDGRTLALSIVDTRIASAQFSGGASERERQILRAVSEAMLKRSLRDAADHAVIAAADRLLAQGLLTRPLGIALPTALSGELARAQDLIRALFRATPAAHATTSWNNEDHGISTRWRTCSEAHKRAAIEAVLHEYLAQRGFSATAIVATTIDRHERIDVSFASEIEPAAQGELLFCFERLLRARTGERLEVFVSPRKDLNRLRRL